MRACAGVSPRPIVLSAEAAPRLRVDARKVFRDQRATLKQTIQDALIACIASGDKAACAAAHIEANAGLSAGCAAFWVDEGLCTLRSCAIYCTLSPKGAQCAACSEANCFPAVEQCGGVPRWAFPP